MPHKHSSDANDQDSSMRGSLFRRERDELSIATGMLGSGLQQQQQQHGKKKRSGSLRGFLGDGQGCEMDMSILGGEDGVVGGEKEGRRRSSASTATARMASWRARFFSNE